MRSQLEVPVCLLLHRLGRDVTESAVLVVWRWKKFHFSVVLGGLWHLGWFSFKFDKRCNKFDL